MFALKDTLSQTKNKMPHQDECPVHPVPVNAKEYATEHGFEFVFGWCRHRHTEFMGDWEVTRQVLPIDDKIAFIKMCRDCGSFMWFFLEIDDVMWSAESGTGVGRLLRTDNVWHVPSIAPDYNKSLLCSCMDSHEQDGEVNVARES